MRYLKCEEPSEYKALGEGAKTTFLEAEGDDLALARAKAMEYLVTTCPMALEKDAFLIGGENPFLFNQLLPCLHVDAFQRSASQAPVDPVTREMLTGQVFLGACFEGHITPGLEQLLGQGTDGLRWRIRDHRARCAAARPEDAARLAWYDAAVLSCDNLDRYADRLRAAALAQADATTDSDWASELRCAAAVLARVPRQPAETLHEALQAHWLAYILVTVEMGGCMPGGGIGLGRPDQYLYPYFRRDVDAGRLTRAQALELMEAWLLNFQHCDYYTPHSIYTVGSQASIGGVTPTGADACNELTELTLEASLRIQMPTPYISVRLHKDAPERVWRIMANFVIGGLGFSIVNDEVLIPAFLRHGRSLGDARDYIGRWGRTNGGYCRGDG